MREKKAVVFSGGGAKGGYQIGAWRALRELNYRPDIVTGTSVGALNGALLALDRFEDAQHIWENMSMDSVFAQFVETANTEAPKRDEIIARLAKEVLLKGGADYTPLQELVRGLMDESALRASPVEFGLVTTQFSPIKAIEVFVEDIPNGMAADYILASAACFPFMKSYKIGDLRFVDGGYSDNMPVQMVLGRGAREIVVINIGTYNHGQSLVNNEADIHYIHNRRPFNNGQPGSMLLFDRTLSLQYMQQGYLDTRKAFGFYDGYYYTFHLGEAQKAEALRPLFAQKFHRIFCGLPNVSRFEKIGRQAVIAKLQEYEEEPFGRFSAILACAELAAEILGLNPRTLYTLDSLTDKILSRVEELLREQNAAQIADFGKTLDRRISLELLRGVVSGWDKRIVMPYIMQLLLQESLTDKQRQYLWILSALESDCLCGALYCYVALIYMQKRDRLEP